MFSGASGPAFWFAVLEVVWVNILLSGDNAVVIALACRGLPPRERMWGMVIGAGFASLLLILFTALVSVLMTLPYLRLASSVALIWIAVKLLAPPRHDKEDTPEAVEDLWRAVRIVVIADIVMSLDNVIAIAAIAKGQYALLALGLIVSIPMVIAGSAIILALIERIPALVWGGAACSDGWPATSSPAIRSCRNCSTVSTRPASISSRVSPAPRSSSPAARSGARRRKPPARPNDRERRQSADCR